MITSKVDTLIFNASYLITVNKENQVHKNYSIAITNGQITHIAPTEELAHLEAKNKFDAHGKILAPGLINTHTHLAMSLLRGWAEGVDLQGFLDRVWTAESLIMNPENVELGTRLGAVESLLAGTTTTLDMYLFPDAAHKGAVSAGIRHISGPIFLDFPGLDGLQWEQRIELAKNWQQVLSEIGGPNVPTFLMPHATYTLSPSHLKQVSELAQQMNAGISIHISENLSENDQIQKKYSKTPTALLESSGVLQSQTIVGHGVHLTDDDIKILARFHAAVAHCPGSNLKLGSGIADIKKYQDSNLAVTLGTDGCSSSNDLDMWSVIRLAANLYSERNGAENLKADQIFRMATIEAAKALGLEDSIGSIEVGKQADLILIDLNKPHLIPLHNIFAQLVFAVGRADVSDVWVDGKHVVAAGKSTLVEFSQLSAQVEKVSIRLHEHSKK